MKAQKATGFLLLFLSLLFAWLLFLAFLFIPWPPDSSIEPRVTSGVFGRVPDRHCSFVELGEPPEELLYVLLPPRMLAIASV